MTDQKSDFDTPVEGSDGILVLRGSGTTRAWNGIRYKTGLSARNVGARRLSMNVATIPHEECNMSATDPVVAVVARSDASEWEHIVDYPSSRRPR